MYRLTVLFAALVTMTAQQSAPLLPYETLFYEHDGLKLETYLYKPQGAGPFPLIVYNHGSTLPDQEPEEWAAPFIARLFVPAGYAVLVPERRGYGKSEGARFSQDIGAERGPRYVARMRAEAGDVNAAVEFILKHAGPSLDPARLAIVGPSFGGVVTTLAASQSKRYRAVVVQAPGAINWEKSPELRDALTSAAAKLRVPTHCSVAENDATTKSALGICEAAAGAGAKTTLKIYPKFESGRERPGNPPGHALFSPAGVSVWQQDVLDFLTTALTAR